MLGALFLIVRGRFAPGAAGTAGYCLPAEPVALPAAVEVAAYRIVTEALTNVVRHARAERCWLTIEAGAMVTIDVVEHSGGVHYQ